MRTYGFTENGTEWRAVTPPLPDDRAERAERALLNISEEREPGEEFWIEVAEIDQERYGKRMLRSRFAKPLIQYQRFDSMSHADKHMGFSYNRVGMARANAGEKTEWTVCGVTFRKFRDR